jgi:hypothetical protein
MQGQEASQLQDSKYVPTNFHWLDMAAIISQRAGFEFDPVQREFDCRMRR